VISSFGQSFSPADLCGWRAKEFREREDSFQQLIGDALHEVHGATAHVSPTLGRDGSIDAWVEQPVSSCNLLGNLDGPVIIECKDHQTQPTWPITWRNILAGWGKVSIKLKDQAEEGFSGKFEPWRRAYSYVYCISATIPDQQSKDDLTSTIKRFLLTIAPHIKDVVVCDWGTLSFWLNKQRRVADIWLGVGHPAITGHLQYIQSLTGFRQYLLNEHLAYEAPDPGTDTHPEVLWEFLAAANAEHQPGLVLHGPGGVGKTRLCLEVATRAYEQGWRVLHLSPTEESLTERDLTEVITADKRPTLLCLDYIDFMQSSDYLIKGIRLVREAANHGTRLRYMANSRPIWAHTKMRESAALETYLFRELRPTDDENERLLRQIVNSVTPMALEKWGYQELRRVCGHRPIIALLIAREIEGRLEKGLLGQDELSAVADGDLSSWLRRRLAQDELTIQQPTSVWKASAPSDEMVAACGALVTAPSSHQILVDAAGAVLRTLGSGTDASFVVRRLIEMGWLEWHGPWLATPHDVVTDEVLDQVARDGNSIRSASLEAVLNLWICDPAAIGRLANALQRWVGALPDGQPAAEKAKTVLVEWLRSHADQIGALLATGDSDRTGFALGTILKWPPWMATASDCWDGLVSPWIAVHGQLREARHLLYMGLHESSLANRLLASALAWLETCYKERDASYVIAPLLEQNGLQGMQLKAAISSALAWLGQFPLEKEAEFVLAPLIERSDLQGKELGAAISSALAWLGQFPLEKEARFIFAPLLGRSDLQGEELGAAISSALAWLGQFPLEKEAGFVLAPLLGRSDLQGKELGAAISSALAWLGQFPLEKEAEFVLDPLLERSELHEKQLEDAIGYAFKWLAKYQLEKEAVFVIAPLIHREELSRTEFNLAVKYALEWLPSYLDTEEAEFLLKRLLPRSPLPEDRIRNLKQLAVNKLRLRVRDAKDERVSFLLRPWLHCRVRHPDLDCEIIGFACEWLRFNPGREGIDYVFNRILRRKDASDADWLFAAQVASDWLSVGNRTFQDKDYAVNSLLTQPAILPYAILQTAIHTGLALLPSIRKPDSKKYFCKKLLRAVKHLPAEDPLAREVMASALVSRLS